MRRKKKKNQPIQETSGFFLGFKEALAELSDFINGYVIMFLSLFFLVLIWCIVDSNTTIQTLTLSYIAFFLGQSLEFKRICGSWKTVILTAFGSFLFSLIVFIPGKREGVYSLQNHLNHWPIAFSVVFLFFTAAGHSRKLIAKIGEGVTLLHSLTLLYFLVELFESWRISSWWAGICIVPVCYSVIHALTYMKITKNDKLYLSLWSSMTMIVFAFVYVKSVLQMKNVEHLISEGRVWDGAYVFFEHFLLGASGAYILQNVFMLVGYFPSKHNASNYSNSVRELNNFHIDRYSSDQVERRESLFILVLVGGMLAANYHFKIVQPNFAIWMCLIVVPIFVALFGKLFR